MVEMEEIYGTVMQTGESLVVTAPSKIAASLRLYPGMKVTFKITEAKPLGFSVADTPSQREYGYFSVPGARKYLPDDPKVYFDVEVDGRTLRCHQGSYGRVTGGLGWGFYNQHPKLRSAAFEVIDPRERKYAIRYECDCHPRGVDESRSEATGPEG